MEKKQLTVVIGVIGADCHSVANKIMDIVFTNAGVKVINLGVMVSQDEYIDAAIETGADAIFVSSIYGHGEIDCQGMRDRCNERGLDGIPLFVGGNLVIGKHDYADIEKTFMDMGYDRVFKADEDMNVILNFLRQDVAKKQEVEAVA